MTTPSLVSRAEGPRTRIRPALIAALVLCLASAARAQSTADSGASETAERSWRLSGFGTLGLVHADVSQPWRFTREITQRGATPR